MKLNEIQELAGWSVPQEVGPGQYARYAALPPSCKFWGAWCADKVGLKSSGISCYPLPNGAWEAAWLATSPEVFGTDQCAVEQYQAEASESPLPLALPAGVVLSDEQNLIVDAVRSSKGNIIVKARAGTGKTFTVTVAISQAPESTILYAIFGKKNEREAVEKIHDNRVTIKTLHALGLSFIKRVWPKAKADKWVEFDRIQALFGELPDEVRNALVKLVGFAKNAFIDPSIDNLVDVCEARDIDCENFEPENLGGWTLTKLAASALKVLELSRKPDPQNRISFNDMVWLPVAMNWVRPSFGFVVIDESQDMSAPQLEMACRASTNRVMVVGDDRQCIYTFRGAVTNAIDMMQKKLHAEVLGLTVTRRCAKRIVAIAQGIVSDYKAHVDAPEGVVDEVSEGEVYQQVAVGDAILSRANAPLMPICLALLRKGISARVEGRDVGKMLLDIVRKLKAKSVPDFIGKAESWGIRMKARMSRSKNSESKCEQIDDQVATLIALAEGVANVAEIETRCVELFSDSDNKPKPAVVLSSVHKAKGLEWSRVFLIDHTFKVRDGASEEANIFYVAVTRAKLHLTFIK